MRHILTILAISGALFSAACTPAPPVADSREVLWSQFGGQPVDGVLMAWGPPMGETRLTDGSRLLTYQHATIYDAGSPYQSEIGCKASFLAKVPHYRIDDVALEGDANECQLLAQGHTGINQIMYVPPPYVYYPPPYRRYPF